MDNMASWRNWLTITECFICIIPFQGLKDATISDSDFFLFDVVLSCRVHWPLIQSSLVLASSMPGSHLPCRLLLCCQCSPAAAAAVAANEGTHLGLGCVCRWRLNSETLEYKRVFVSFFWVMIKMKKNIIWVWFPKANYRKERNWKLHFPKCPLLLP